MLVLAIPTIWPYSYYELLRWVVAVTGIFNAYQANRLRLKGWTITMIIVAILFNPIASLTFSKGTWILFDLATAFVMFVITAEFKHNKIN